MNRLVRWFCSIALSVALAFGLIGWGDPKKVKRTKLKIIQICDPNHNDLDDEASIVVLRALLARYSFEVATIIANTNPEYKRAQVARGLLDHLGLKHIRLGVGDRVMPEADPFPDVDLITYIHKGEDLPDGKPMLLDELQKADPQSVVLVVQAAMTEVAWLLKDYPELMKDKVIYVASMSGVKPQLSEKGYLLPGDAMNVKFDEPAAAYAFQALQDLGIPLLITTRNATFAAMLNHKVFTEMGEVGRVFASRVNKNTQRFWVSCNAPEGDPRRGKLSISRNRDWFVKTFCGGIDPGIGIDDNIIPYIKADSWPQYDPINLVAAIPELRDMFFTPKIVTVNGVNHMVIGWSPEEHGVKEPAKLVEFLNSLLVKGASFYK